MAASRRKPGLDSSRSLLLSNVTARPGSGRARGAAASGSARPREPVAVDALPLSSSDDDDDGDDETPTTHRGDLSRTTFQRPAAATAATATRRKGGGPTGGALPPRVRPPAKRLLVAVERKRQGEADAQRAEEAEAERVRGTSTSRGTKRARPKEDEPTETAATTAAVALKARQSPPSPPSSASLQDGLHSSSGNGRGSGPLDLGCQRPRSVGYGRRPAGLLVRGDRTTGTAAAGSEATSRAGKKDAKTKPSTKEAEAGVARFIPPPRLTPEQDSPPPTFRHWKGAAGNTKDTNENEDAFEKPAFKWPAGLPRKVTTDADDEDKDTHKKANFKRPAVAPRGSYASTDEDGDGVRDMASFTKTKTTTTRVTKATKTASPPPPPPPARTTAQTPTGATLESLKKRQKWRLNLDAKKQKQQQQKGPRRAAGTKGGTSSLFGELELETGAVDDDVEEVTPQEQRAVFKMPAGYDGRPAAPGTADTATGDDGPTLDDLLVADSDDGDSSDSTMPLEQPPATCPVCKVSVDDETVRALLATLLPGDAAVLAALAMTAAATREGGRKGRGRAGTNATAADLVRRHLLRFDDKLRFCEGHRQRASRAAWVARGYPAIDWAALGGRLRAHYGHVRRILEDETPSVFRAAMEGRGGDGGGGGSGGRGRKRGEGDGQSGAVTPGYYGQKGLRVLTEAIVLEFAGLLRQRAVADRLIAARGSSQFVEAVLVPELAVQLIREDMGVGAAEAQRILWESGTIGEDVHGEERDVVVEEEDDDVEEEDDDDDRW